MDELFASGMKLSFPQYFSYIFENGDETEASKVLTNLADCPSYEGCMEWAMYQKNVSLIMEDIYAEYLYATGIYSGENSEHLICKLEDGEFL